jgi:hypothetical protein
VIIDLASPSIASALRKSTVSLSGMQCTYPAQ